MQICVRALLIRVTLVVPLCGLICGPCAVAQAQVVAPCGTCGGPLPCKHHLPRVSVHDRGPGPCTVDGICIPNTMTFGYSQPRWRRWPGSAQSDAAGRRIIPPELAPIEVVRPEEEDVRRPAPVRPQPADEAAGGTPPQTTPAPPSIDFGGPGMLAPPPAPLPGEQPPAAQPAPPPVTSPPPQEPPAANPFGNAPDNPFSRVKSQQDEHVQPVNHAVHGDDPPPLLPAGLQAVQRQHGPLLEAMARQQQTLLAAVSAQRLPELPANPFPVVQASANMPANFAAPQPELNSFDSAVRPAVHLQDAP